MAQVTDDEKHSERIFWVIQTAFSLVLVQSFVLYRAILLDPLAPDHVLSALALLVLYITVILSWIDFSFSALKSPYRFSDRVKVAKYFRQGTLERFRFALDFLIVALYALLLFSVEKIATNRLAFPAAIADLYVAVFLLYAFSGFLRKLQHGKNASRLFLILVFLFVFTLLRVSVFGLEALVGQYDGPDAQPRGLAYLWLALFIMLFYRVVRRRMTDRDNWLVVDIDGVLANQIRGLLPKLSEYAARPVLEDEIVEWNQQFGEKFFADVIVQEQRANNRYVSEMPVHTGARASMEYLHRHYRIALNTARPLEARDATDEWLRTKQIPFDLVINSKEGAKDHESALVLLDDYPGNLVKWLDAKPGRYGVLMSRPWNVWQNGLGEHIASGRVLVAYQWEGEDVIYKVELQLRKCGQLAPAWKRALASW